MDLAERFNEASEALSARGHRVVVRRARSLVSAGSTADAAAFLADAGERMRDASLVGLADALRGWMEDGGDVEALVAGAGWTAGVDAESAVSRDIGRTVEAQQVSTLVAQMRPQTVAAPAPTARVHAEMSPSEMPPLPSRPQVSAPDSSEPARSAAVVEAPSRLQERKLNLSEPTPQKAPAETFGDALADAPPAVEVSSPPPSLEVVDEAAIDSGVLPAAEVPAEAPGQVRQPAPSDAIMRTGFENLPQIDAPPSLAVKTPEKDKTGGNGAAYALLVVTLAAAAVAYWFMFLKPAG